MAAVARPSRHRSATARAWPVAGTGTAGLARRTLWPRVPLPRQLGLRVAGRQRLGPILLQSWFVFGRQASCFGREAATHSCQAKVSCQRSGSLID